MTLKTAQEQFELGCQYYEQACKLDNTVDYFDFHNELDKQTDEALKKAKQAFKAARNILKELLKELPKEAFDAQQAKQLLANTLCKYAFCYFYDYGNTLLDRNKSLAAWLEAAALCMDINNTKMYTQNILPWITKAQSLLKNERQNDAKLEEKNQKIIVDFYNKKYKEPVVIVGEVETISENHYSIRGYGK